MGLLPPVTFPQNQELFKANAAREERRKAFMKAKSKTSSSNGSTKSQSSYELAAMAKSTNEVFQQPQDSLEKKTGNKNLVFDGGNKKVLDGIAKAFRSM